MVGRRLLHHRLVPGRVERLAGLGVDRRDAVAGEDLQELRLRGDDALDERVVAAGLFGGVDGAVEVVERGQEVAGQADTAYLRSVVALPGVAGLVVLEVGLCPLQQRDGLVEVAFDGSEASWPGRRRWSWCRFRARWSFIVGLCLLSSGQLASVRPAEELVASELESPAPKKSRTLSRKPFRSGETCLCSISASSRKSSS